MDYKNKNDIIFVVVFPLLFCSHGGQSFILVLILLFYTRVPLSQPKVQVGAPHFLHGIREV